MRFLRQNDATASALLPPSIPSLQTRELPSAFRTLAGVLCCTSQVSFDSLRSILSQGGLKMICRRSRHSFWQLGRPNFHERSMPFIPRQRHFHPPQTSSHQASSQPLPLAPAPRVSYCVVTTPSWKRESLDEKTWGQGRHFGPLRPSFGQKLHSLHTHTMTQGKPRRYTRGFAFDTSRSDQQHLCSGSAASDATPRRSPMGDACRPHTDPAPVPRPLI